MKKRLVEVTLQFESTAPLSTIRSRVCWGYQLRLAREFEHEVALNKAAAIARSGPAKVRVVRAGVVKKTP